MPPPPPPLSARTNQCSSTGSGVVLTGVVSIEILQMRGGDCLKTIRLIKLLRASSVLYSRLLARPNTLRTYTARGFYGNTFSRLLYIMDVCPMAYAFRFEGASSFDWMCFGGTLKGEGHL